MVEKIEDLGIGGKSMNQTYERGLCPKVQKYRG
jgi:hypothetical protein